MSVLPAGATELTKAAAPIKTITTEELFEDMREIMVLHAGAKYRLRITSNGKLILTK